MTCTHLEDCWRVYEDWKNAAVCLLRVGGLQPDWAGQNHVRAVWARRATVLLCNGKTKRLDIKDFKKTAPLACRLQVFLISWAQNPPWHLGRPFCLCRSRNNFELPPRSTIPRDWGFNGSNARSTWHEFYGNTKSLASSVRLRFHACTTPRVSLTHFTHTLCFVNAVLETPY